MYHRAITNDNINHLFITIETCLQHIVKEHYRLNLYTYAGMWMHVNTIISIINWHVYLLFQQLYTLLASYLIIMIAAPLTFFYIFPTYHLLTSVTCNFNFTLSGMTMFMFCFVTTTNHFTLCLYWKTIVLVSLCLCNYRLCCEQ